ncbi:MAG TPA: dienelactone hydrolase family protein [Candidatus Rubrimentiphilum sp.]|nr:dienelactone hydrolase family protein [Candidatus Rubrimentiphilum sp.]
MNEREIELRAGGNLLAGTLGMLNGNARGLIVFAHGSGSGRRSPRNRFVAGSLNEAGFATLLLDLLTADEERIDDRSGELRFDIGLLARRMVDATEWARNQSELGRLPIGYFGASTGAAAALVAASTRKDVAAVVSRGGRPDLAGGALDSVTAPVLLIVGSRDPVVLNVNRIAASRLRDSELAIVPGATHLFEEPGTLEEVTALARRFFATHLPVSGAP